LISNFECIKQDRQGEESFMSRITQLRNILEEKELDGFLVSNIINVRYLSGFSGSSGDILVTSEEAYFICDGRYIQQAEEEIKEGFKLIKMEDTLPETLKRLFHSYIKIKRLGIESETLSYYQYNLLKKALDFLEIIPVEYVINKLRCIKSSEEIQKIKESINIAYAAYDEICSLVRSGMSERALACELEYRIRRQGGNIAFEPIVASGIRSSLPHAKASDKILQRHEVLLIDWGVCFQGYNCDITRVISVEDKIIDSKLKELYDIIKDVQNYAIRELIPQKIPLEEIENQVKKRIDDMGYGNCWLHKIGHGIGLEVHEELDRSTPLAAGMVLTVEPGIYIKDIGGIRIEDMVLITNDGCEVLTEMISK
jgi:Xaa-Pro aminopeptidase